MTTYNTGNPVGSADPKDLFDNAENLDHWINDRTVDTWMDRLGVERWTWFGMEQAFEESQETRLSLFNSEQEDRETRFQSQLNGMGYVPIGDYDDGPLNITERTEIFTKDGNWWRSSAALELPYTTIENWATDEANFVNIGEATLRSELAATGGVELVGDALDKRQNLADINDPVAARENLGVDQFVNETLDGRGMAEYAVYFPVAEINDIVDQGVYVTSGTLAQIGVNVPGDWGSIAGSIVMRVTRRQNLSPGDIIMQEITFQALNALGGIRYARTKYIGSGPGTLWSPWYESSEQIAKAAGFIDELNAEGFSQRIPGGLIMKFGKFTRTGPSPVDFIDGAFPSIVFGVHLQVISPGGGWWLEPRNVTTSGFEFAAAPGPNTPPNWTDGTYIAFGF